MEKDTSNRAVTFKISMLDCSNHITIILFFISFSLLYIFFSTLLSVPFHLDFLLHFYLHCCYSVFLATLLVKYVKWVETSLKYLLCVCYSISTISAAKLHPYVLWSSWLVSALQYWMDGLCFWYEGTCVIP